MFNVTLSSSQELLIAVPFLCVFFVAVFRLDEGLARGKRSRTQEHPPCGVNQQGEYILSDPDGTVWGSPSPTL